MHALAVHRTLAELLRPDDCLVFDGGDFCHWGRSYHRARLPRRWWYLPTIGLLGSALPAAIAAKIAHPERRVIAFTGDGAFGFNAMEIETALRHNLPVVFVVDNNQGILGSTIESTLFAGEYPERVGMYVPDARYDRMIEAFGGHGEHVERPEEIRPALERALAADRAACINVVIDPTERQAGRTVSQLRDMGY